MGSLRLCVPELCGALGTDSLPIRPCAAGEVPKEYIGRRNMLSYEDGVGTVLLTEGVHFVIDEEGV